MGVTVTVAAAKRGGEGGDEKEEKGSRGNGAAGF